MDYSFIDARAASGDVAQYAARILPTLIDRWIAARGPGGDVSEVRTDGYNYLFEHGADRTLAAYGLSRASHLKRDAARMAGHPKSEGRAYHRGHMMPHSAGGGTDINLFSQLGAVNIGAFRRLERLAVAHPGSLYFVHLIYTSDGQRPTSVEQGLLLNAGVNTTFSLATHAN